MPVANVTQVALGVGVAVGVFVGAVVTMGVGVSVGCGLSTTLTESRAATPCESYAVSMKVYIPAVVPVTWVVPLVGAETTAGGPAVCCQK